MHSLLMYSLKFQMFGEFNNLNNDGKSVSCSNVTDPLSEDYDDPLKERIIVFIAKKNEVILKSQQKNEPDFTFEERKEIATEILEKNPCQFLYR